MGNHRRRNVDSLAEPRTHGFREYVNSSEMRQTFPPGGQSEHRLRSGIVLMPDGNSRRVVDDGDPVAAIGQCSRPLILFEVPAEGGFNEVIEQHAVGPEQWI